MLPLLYPGCSRCPSSSFGGPGLMLALRIAGILVVLVTAGAVVLYLLTRDRKYLGFAFRVFKYTLIFALLVFGLLILERAFMLV